VSTLIALFALGYEFSGRAVVKAGLLLSIILGILECECLMMQQLTPLDVDGA